MTGSLLPFSVWALIPPARILLDGPHYVCFAKLWDTKLLPKLFKLMLDHVSRKAMVLGYRKRLDLPMLSCHVAKGSNPLFLLSCLSASHGLCLPFHLNSSQQPAPDSTQPKSVTPYDFPHSCTTRKKLLCAVQCQRSLESESIGQKMIPCHQQSFLASRPFPRDSQRLPAASCESGRLHIPKQRLRHL